MPQKRTDIYRTFSSEETKHLGAEFSKRLSAVRNRRKTDDGKGAVVVVLSGELGAGKTTFVQGFLRGMGVRRRAPSPTFIIVRRYRIPRGKTEKAISQIFHMDAYRLKDVSQLATLGFEEMIRDPQNIVLIEWGERIKTAVPRGAARVRFGYDKKEGVRKISITLP